MTKCISAIFILSVVGRSMAFSSLSGISMLQRVGFSNIESRRFAQIDEKNNVFSDEVQQEAREVLEKVGWASPMELEGELTSDDPFVKQINEGIQRDFGVDLDDLLNPAKVIEMLSFGVCKTMEGGKKNLTLQWPSHFSFAMFRRWSTWSEIYTI